MCQQCATSPIKCNRTLMRDLTPDEMLASFPGISPKMVEWWFSPRGGNLQQSDLTIEEFVTNRCETCNEIIQIYPRWEGGYRMRMITPARCDACAQELIDAGADPHEARYVS